MKKAVLLFIVLFAGGIAGISQNSKPGILVGTILGEDRKSVEHVLVQLIFKNDSSRISYTETDKNGFFSFSQIELGYYKLSFSHISFQNLVIDSIFFRNDRYDFNLNEIVLKLKTNQSLNEIVVYAEKPLFQSKEGNITFNASESALAAGSTASELLQNVPLVTKDPNGKILVRGKEPKILIDDKPVELNLQQLQDLLESLPGSSIEKIEVMTNPPPQYASEQGGVINIVTKKGKIGMGGRISLSAGSRGDQSVNGSFNYRKNKFALNINGGTGFNRFSGEGNSSRRYLVNDSSNYLNTVSHYENETQRPNYRLTIDYDIAKNQTLNLVVNMNQNDFDNKNFVSYTHLNLLYGTFGFSERDINSTGFNDNKNVTLSYLMRGKKKAGQLKFIMGSNRSVHENNRLFDQQYFMPNRLDSSQRQITENNNSGYHLRINYDKTLSNKKTSYSLGSFYSDSKNDVVVAASYKQKPENIFVPNDLWSNQFQFEQRQFNIRASGKQIFADHFSMLLGVNAEATQIEFDLAKELRKVENQYWNFLPFANLNKNWNEKVNLTLSYRRTIRRPGITELNPTIDFSEAYNIRYGNYQLKPTLAHNFDFVVGKNQSTYFLNVGLGFNKVEDIFSTIRSLRPDGTTQITWENISHRKEYEISTWNGFTITRGLKVNVSASYTYNVYSEWDKRNRRFKDGGSFTSNINAHYFRNENWNVTGNGTLNRFANPQGAVNWNVSMNVGIQKKFLQKKLIATINFIDPFRQQQTKSFTAGQNFELHSFQSTNTKNFRLSLAYNFLKTSPKKALKLPLKKPVAR